MTREEAKELLSIIQAYAEGKTIQFLDGGKWADVYETDFISLQINIVSNQSQSTDHSRHKKSVGMKL